jgi:alpha-amylase
MNWQDVTGKQALTVAHWQTLGQFRARHPAIGEGKQTTLSLKEGMASCASIMAIR